MKIEKVLERGDETRQGNIKFLPVCLFFSNLFFSQHLFSSRLVSPHLFFFLFCHRSLFSCKVCIELETEKRETFFSRSRYSIKGKTQGDEEKTKQSSFLRPSLYVMEIHQISVGPDSRSCMQLSLSLRSPLQIHLAHSPLSFARRALFLLSRSIYLCSVDFSLSLSINASRERKKEAEKAERRRERSSYISQQQLR